MPEKTGTVTGFIKKRDGTVFGLNIDGDEYLYSFPDKRAEPWDAARVRVGDVVRIEYSPYEKDGKTKQYLAVIELRVEGDADGGGPEPPPDEVDLPTSPHGPDTRVSEWGYRHKDILMFIESCAKGACTIYAAALAGGQLKEMPKSGEITALARSIEEHGVARFKALMGALD